MTKRNHHKFSKATKAPNIKPEVAHAPDEEDLDAVACAPEELLDTKESLQQMKGAFAETIPNSFSAFIANVSKDVRDFQDPQKAIQYIDSLMFAVIFTELNTDPLLQYSKRSQYSKSAILKLPFKH